MKRTSRDYNNCTLYLALFVAALLPAFSAYSQSIEAILPSNESVLAQKFNDLLHSRNTEDGNAAGLAMELKELALQNPEDAYYHSSLAFVGRIHEQNGQYDDALAAYHLALEDNTETVPVSICLLNIANTLYKTGNLDQSMDYFHQAHSHIVTALEGESVTAHEYETLIALKFNSRERYIELLGQSGSDLAALSLEELMIDDYLSLKGSKSNVDSVKTFYEVEHKIIALAGSYNRRMNLPNQEKRVYQKYKGHKQLSEEARNYIDYKEVASAIMSDEIINNASKINKIERLLPKVKTESRIQEMTVSLAALHGREGNYETMAGLYKQALDMQVNNDESMNAYLCYQLAVYHLETDVNWSLAELYIQELLTKYPDTEFAKLISDPMWADTIENVAAGSKK